MVRSGCGVGSGSMVAIFALEQAPSVAASAMPSASRRKRGAVRT
jgi:hypothetical protein